MFGIRNKLDWLRGFSGVGIRPYWAGGAFELTIQTVFSDGKWSNGYGCGSQMRKHFCIAMNIIVLYDIDLKKSNC